jgi:hypothetical protein
MTPPPEWPHDRLGARLNELLSAHLHSTGPKGTLYVSRAAPPLDEPQYLS